MDDRLTAEELASEIRRLSDCIHYMEDRRDILIDLLSSKLGREELGEETG